MWRFFPALISGLVGSIFASAEASAATSISKGPWVQRVTSTSAVIRVEVHPPGPVTFDIRDDSPASQSSTDGGSGHRLIESAEVKSLHAIPVDGLRSGSRYSYVVRAAAASKEASFVTAPLDEGNAPFRFVVYGDTRTDDAAHAAVIRAVASASGDFLVHTGDFVSNGASLSQWQKFFEVEAPVLSTRCVYSCVGNHELTDGAGIEYARFFGPTDLATSPSGQATRPEHLDGTFRWGNTRFFLINGMVTYKNGPDRMWLERALAAADTEAGLKWRIVVLHHGPWSSGPHGNNTHLQEAGVMALFKEHKVDLIFSGHDHIYERGWGDGLAYVVSGGGGAPLYKIKSPQPQARRTESAHHFVNVSVSGASLQLTAVRADGSTLEQCALGKDFTGWDCDRGEPARPTPSSTSRCSCDVPGSTTASETNALFAAAGAAGLSGVLTFLRRRRRLATRVAPSILGR